MIIFLMVQFAVVSGGWRLISEPMVPVFRMHVVTCRALRLVSEQSHNMICGHNMLIDTHGWLELNRTHPVRAHIILRCQTPIAKSNKMAWNVIVMKISAPLISYYCLPPSFQFLDEIMAISDRAGPVTRALPSLGIVKKQPAPHYIDRSHPY